MKSEWVEAGRAFYGGGLVLAWVAFLLALPSVLRVIRGLTAALSAFTIAIGNRASEAEAQREQLALVKRIAEKLGVSVDP